MNTKSLVKVVIEAKNLTKKFENKVVFNKLNFKIQEGQSIGIMGPSGTGKSVLLKCILGLTPYDGKILYKERLLEKKNRKKFLSNSGMLFQGGALFDSLPVWQNVIFKLTNGRKKIPKQLAFETAILKLQDVGLDKSIAHLMPSEISGGMQKRVALARALVDKPNLLFFDEPTTGLDPLTSSSINELIKNIIKKENITSLVISHDPFSIKKICDEVMFVENGMIGWRGKVSEMENSKYKLLQEYLKSS